MVHVGRQPLFQFFLAGRATGIVIAIFLWMNPAIGGVIAFDVHAADRILTITNTGDSAAYGARVFALQAGGEWRPLAVAGKPSFQWDPQEAFSFALFPSRHVEQARSLASLRAVMVCFFDQAGVESGRLAFLNPLPRADGLLGARYKDGKLELRPPDQHQRISATWVLWTRGDGIEPLAAPIHLQRPLPGSIFIRWVDTGLQTQEIDTGHGLPAAYLVHEVVARGGPRLVLQVVPEGEMAGSAQRSRWLSQGPVFCWIGGALFAAGAIVLLIPTVGALRKRRQRR